MSIILDPSKNFVNIQILYVEEKKPHGSSIFHFVKSEEEMNDWKSKGYAVREKKAHALPSTDVPQPTISINKTPAANNGQYIEQMHTKWTRLTWSEQNAIYSKCLFQSAGPDGKSRNEFDGIKYRELKLKKCLKEWDALDDDGKLIILNEGMINLMVPEVAQHLLESFERVTEPTGDDLGK